MVSTGEFLLLSPSSHSASVQKPGEPSEPRSVHCSCSSLLGVWYKRLLDNHLSWVEEAELARQGGDNGTDRGQAQRGK